MEKRKSLGAWLEQQEQKNPLRFKTYYPAFVMEFSFLAVILAFALARLVTGGFDALNRGIGWLEPLEMLISCLLHPLILAILHYKDCRKNGAENSLEIHACFLSLQNFAYTYTIIYNTIKLPKNQVHYVKTHNKACDGTVTGCAKEGNCK